MTMVQTHWFGCWKDHHVCAKALLERASATLRDALDEVEDLEGVTGPDIRGVIQMIDGPDWEVRSADNMEHPEEAR